MPLVNKSLLFYEQLLYMTQSHCEGNATHTLQIPLHIQPERPVPGICRAVPEYTWCLQKCGWILEAMEKWVSEGVSRQINQCGRPGECQGWYIL